MQILKSLVTISIGSEFYQIPSYFIKLFSNPGLASKWFQSW